MQYDLTSDFQRKAFFARMNYFLDKGAIVEMTEKTFRTKSQNSYLHLIIGVIAMETGVTIEYAKENYFKRLVNPDLFVVRIEDKYVGTVETLRSSAKLTKEEMSIAIDRFKRWATEQGFYLPSEQDESLLRQIAIEMGRQRANIGY